MNKISITKVVQELYTIQDMLRWATSRFCAANIWYGHGTDNPWDEAVQLVLSSLYLPLDIPGDISTARLTNSEKYNIAKRVMRRIHERIPIAYLTNKAWFCGHEFYVDQNVLIPRSPIGELINNRFNSLVYHEPRRILDMCTGSGCIAISCAYTFPKVKIDAVDISPTAIAVAKHNIEIHGLSEYVTPICSDLFNELPILDYDIIITNPPYIDAGDLFTLPDEYRHEPELGLTPGSDGLELIRRILTCSSSYLNNTGILICEVGNSMLRLQKEYPYIPFNWLQLHNGGDGVFMLTKKQLLSAQKYLHT